MKTIISNQASAFSLIELLVVISIIALLLGILLPVLGLSREEARNAICMTHLDQIFKACYVYVNEHDDYLPRFGYPPTDEQLADETAAGIRPIWWAAQINRELNGVTEIYRCPSDEDPLQDFQVVRLPGGTLAVSGGTEPGRFALDITYRGFCDMITSRNDIYYGRRITEWDTPSNIPTLIETYKETTSGAPGPCYRFVDLWPVGTEEWYATNPYVHVWERHNGTSNLLFLDGRVTRMEPSEVSKIKWQLSVYEFVTHQ